MLSANIHNKHMSNLSSYKLQIKCVDPNDFTLNSVITAPRVCTPLNVRTACQNVSIEAQGEEPPALVMACARFLLVDFFALAHRTGLYNRQPALWQALGRVTDIEVNRHTQGLFQKTDLPVVDISFKDGKGRLAIMGVLIDDPAFIDDDRKQREFFRGTVARAVKLRSSKELRGGIVVFIPEPIPNNVLTDIIKQTSGNDPVARYESLLPEPVGLTIDLVEYGWPGGDPNHVELHLAHPDIAVAARNARDNRNQASKRTSK